MDTSASKIPKLILIARTAGLLAFLDIRETASMLSAMLGTWGPRFGVA